MRATCNKREDNFITYHSTREKIINNVREWEKLNPEKRKEYTIKYYKTEKGHRKRLAQQKRYREKRKLIKENEKLKNDKMELLNRVDKAIEYINQHWTGGYIDSALKYKVEELNITELLEILRGRYYETNRRNKKNT